eukprot:7377496-Prymnesium_polylepis.1
MDPRTLITLSGIREQNRRLTAHGISSSGRWCKLCSSACQLMPGSAIESRLSRKSLSRPTRPATTARVRACTGDRDGAPDAEG